MRGRLLLGVAAMLFSACGLGVVGGGTDAGESPEAGADVGGTDVTPPPPPPPEADGSFEAATDGGADADAALDAPPDAPLTFCQTVSPPPTFCADFDGPAAVPGTGWTTVLTDAGATVALSSTYSVSAPRSLHVTSTQSATAGLEKSLTVTTSLTVDFEVRFTDVPEAGVVGPMRISPPAPFPGQDFYVYEHTFGLYFQEYGDDYSNTIGTPPSLNAWHHVSFAIQANGGGWTVTTAFDGTNTWTNHPVLHPWTKPVTVGVALGVVLYGLAVGETYVDNVVIRAQ